MAEPRFSVKRLVAVLALGAAGLVQAQTATTGSMPANGQAAPAVQQFTLDNGLTVLVKPDHRAPTAVHMLWVRTGSMDEVDGYSGLAHALEHMMFKGTPTVPAGGFSARVAALGGNENAFTSMDNTAFFQQIPASRLEDVMKLEADRFAHNQWPDGEFAREIEVIKEERRLRTDDNPRAVLYERLAAAAFIAHPYRRPIIGWMTDLQEMTPDDVRAFYRRWYVPANAALVVAGDVQPDEVLRLAQKYYGPIAAGDVPVRKSRAEPPQKGQRRIEVKAQASQPFVVLAYQVPKLASATDFSPQDDDALALTLLAGVLDGYSGARLERALTQGPERVADSVGAGNSLIARGPTMFYLSGVPAEGKTAAQVEAALRWQVARVAREGVSQAELDRVRTQWIAGEIYQRDSIFSQAREMGSMWVQGLPQDTSERLIARLRTITTAQVQDVAGRYFGDDRLTVATLVPQTPDGARRINESAPEASIMNRL